MWFKRCKHDWKIIKKTYAPPAAEGCKLSGQGDGLNLMQRLAFGVTTVLVQCSKCHKIKIYEMLGKELEEEKEV